MSGELVLVVCAANVCRSPLAELLLRRSLADLPDVRVESAGTRVREPARICEVVAARADTESWRSFCLAHRSRPVTAELMRDASLILVADREVRSEVVRSVPEVRDYVFTLRDAAFLADGFVPGEPTRRAGLASRFAMHLDRTRAVRGQPRGRAWRRRRAEDWSSIEDGHGRTPRHHERALNEVTASANAIAAALVGPKSEGITGRRS